MNKEGYNEYRNAGSVRDYFLKSSYGMFRPTFNVMAPVTLSKTKAYYGGRSDTDRNFNGTVQAVREALQLLDWNAIDFSLYDNDGNGVVDFVSVIFAGVGSDGSGIVESIWPHKGSVGNMMVGGGLVVESPFTIFPVLIGEMYETFHCYYWRGWLYR